MNGIVSTPVHNLADFTKLLAHPVVPPAATWKTVPVQIARGELADLEALCHSYGLVLIDTIDRQLADLALIHFPSPDDATTRARFLAELEDRETIGNWMYVPWEGRVVHLLDADAYFEVITNRNRDKITRAEQLLLRTRRIGVIGLSVGGEAALTVAQEHLCGAIVLADFDELDLSNLNRLGASFTELGENKARIVARRIARIDPYIDVTILEDGVTSENVTTFMAGLDLLIEECDDLRMKWEMRRLARAHSIDIVFAGDERGFLSIEPHGTVPNLAEFHGRILAEPLPRAAYPDTLSFMRALADWLGGWDALSERSRCSLEQIGDTLCGYPQLAGEARYAAAQIAHVARRLLLGEAMPPFIGHLDLEAMLPVNQ
jgi:hypothetical protein